MRTAFFWQVQNIKQGRPSSRFRLLRFLLRILFFYHSLSSSGVLILPCHTFSVQLFSSANLWICSAALPNPQEHLWPQKKPLARGFFWIWVTLIILPAVLKINSCLSDRPWTRLSCLTTCLPQAACCNPARVGRELAVQFCAQAQLFLHLCKFWTELAASAKILYIKAGDKPSRDVFSFLDFLLFFKTKTM